MIHSLKFQRCILAAIILGTLLLTSTMIWRATVHSADRVGSSNNEGPPTESVKLIPVLANDIAYNSANDTIFASVPSSAGPTGNSIQSIDPRTGLVGSSVFIGSEPTKLETANDGQTLYVFLDGAYSIRKFDMISQTAGTQFSLGFNSSDGRYKASSMAVSPAGPNVLAVARTRPGVSPPGGGVAIFNAGVQLNNVTPGHSDSSDYLTYSASASTLYGTGQFSGLKTMTVNASGVSVTNSSTVASGARIKFSNGVIYTSAGQAINPATNSVLGTFTAANTVAFVPDAAAGRAYYLVKVATGVWTLKAFDLVSFGLVGSFNITNVSGDATTMIRWGGNGLAFRTTTNRVYVVQTNLIPSGDPIPTPTVTTSPTATPSPTPFTTSFRTVPIGGSDVAYSPTTQKIYVSVPSSSGSNGNSIAVVDPVSETVESTVFVGSEPKKLVFAADDQTLYVHLNGARAIRRFDVSTLIAGVQFPIGVSTDGGPLQALDFDVARDNPNIVTAARCATVYSPCYAGSAVYENGVMRPQLGPGTSSVAFGSSSSSLYGAGTFLNGFERMSVNSTGVTGSVGAPLNANFQLRFGNGLVYTRPGQVIDPQTLQIVGTFPVTGDAAEKFIIDSQHGRIFYLQWASPVYKITAYDLNTYLPIGSISLPSGTSATSMARWGTNGIAVTGGPRLLLVQSNLVDPLEPVPSFTPTTSPTATISPSPTPPFARRVNQISNDLAYNPSDGMIYASVPSTATDGTANTITRIDPSTGGILSSVPVGTDPTKLALSDDGGSLYAALGQQEPYSVRRYDLASHTAGLQFPTQISYPTRDIAVRPGNPDTVVVGCELGGAAIYDNGVKRPNIPMDGGSRAVIGRFSFLGSPDILYGFDTYSSAAELFKVSVDPNGLNTVSSIQNLIPNFTGWEAADGKLFTTGGRAVDPLTNAMTGTFSLPSSGNAIAVDATLRRVFIVGGGSNSISVFDMDTYLQRGTIPLPSTDSPQRMVRWGQNGLAIRMLAENPYIYLIQSPLISSSGVVPTGLSFAAATYTTFETSGSRTITVNRSGDLSASSTVNYSTVDGTATGGQDYTPASGTLTFAAGETAKTFAVPILNDTIFESAETFGVNISQPGGNEVIVYPATTTVTINDNDQPPRISNSNASVNEAPFAQTSIANVPVTLTNPSTQTVTVNFSTADGSAIAGDYVGTNGVLTFQPLETVKNVPVTIIGDSEVEGDETFFLNLTNPVNGTILNGTATITIVDSAPVVGVTGTIVYGNAVGAPTPRFVSDVSVSADGSPTITTLTGPPGPNAGRYALTGFGSGSYTVTPTKSGGVNGSISSFDAAKIAQHVAGVNILTGNQLAVADVSGNSTISSFDAGQIARYVAAVPGSGSAGIWKFNPIDRMYSSVTTSISGEDYSALLMGEVSGNWTNAGARPAETPQLAADDVKGPVRDISVELPQVTASTDNEIIIPVKVQGAADKEIISYEIDLRYDPSVIQPVAEPIDVKGTVSRGLMVIANPNEPGLLRVVVYGTMPIEGDGILLNLRFTTVGAIGSISRLKFERIMFNEGEFEVITVGGQVHLF